MSDDFTRWQIQWVREYRQFLIEPPTDYEPSTDEWMDISFDTIGEAMDWIEAELVKAPVQESVIDQVPVIESVGPPVEPVRTVIPPYVSKPMRQQYENVIEPQRVYSPGENVPRRVVTNPIGGQEMSESKRDRLEMYQNAVGL